jgi:hypothetical protein
MTKASSGTIVILDNCMYREINWYPKMKMVIVANKDDNDSINNFSGN